MIICLITLNYSDKMNSTAKINHAIPTLKRELKKIKSSFPKNIVDLSAVLVVIV